MIDPNHAVPEFHLSLLCFLPPGVCLHCCLNGLLGPTNHLVSLPPCSKSCCFCAATCSRTAFICSTLRAQVYCCTVRDAASPRRRHRSASPQSRWMTYASSSASVGSCKTRPSTPFEMISEPPLFREVTTGRPQAIASAGGKAKESCRDGPT